jgi:hypothetical protein
MNKNEVVCSQTTGTNVSKKWLELRQGNTLNEYRILPAWKKRIGMNLIPVTVSQ